MQNSVVDMHIALLRAVNVGGSVVPMAQLRAVAQGLGFGQVRSLLNSGNLVLSSAALPAEVERLLEDALARQMGVATAIMARTALEWSAAIAANPFPIEAAEDPSHLLVVFLKASVYPPAVEHLQASIRGPELVRAQERQLYITYPAGIGTSKLTMSVIERAVGTRGTGRNWNTLLKLQALADCT
ncbi:MAG: DUF1697 domain-containing protein [Chloroflexota bacterium]